MSPMERRNAPAPAAPAGPRDLVEAYQDALHAFDRARAKVEHMIAAVKDAAMKLDEWDQIKIDGVNQPAATAFRTVNWDNLRPGRELADALRDWHRLREEAFN